MGCNTSQELKTKDGTNAAMNGDGGCDGVSGGGNNSNNMNEQQNEQNGNIIENRSQRTGSCGGSGSGSGSVGNIGDGQNKSALSHANHPKSNSIMTNGDASTVKHPRGDATGFDSAKHHHHNQQHHGLFNGDSRGQCEKAELSEFNDCELDDDEAKAATKIQAAFRGHQVRSTMKKSETKTSSSTTNTNNQNQQSSSSGGAAKNGTASTAAEAAGVDPSQAELEAEFDPNDKELCDAAMKIQATFRGHLARKLVNKDVPEDDDIKEITKKVAEELDIDLTDPELNKAATKIQASFRGHKTRKEVGPSAE